MRRLSGLPHVILYTYIVCVGLFHLYTAIFGSYEAYLQRTIHLMLVLPLAYILFPINRFASRDSVPWYDWILGLIAMLPGLYGIFYYDEIVQRMQQVDPLTFLQMFSGSLLVIMLLEGSRRVVGLPLSLIAGVFGAYMCFGNYMPGILKGLSLSMPEVIEQLFLTDEGIFSMPLGVSATFVIVFLIFGGFLEKSGVGDYFMSLACALMGKKPGGPAQIAVVSSCLFGSISGSAVANVYGTGSFTIPLMKRIGYSPSFSGAVEAAASTGGQIMPPVMGAGAFLMASFLGIQYKEVMLSAIFPALMYYGALLLMVRLTALRNGMKGMSDAELPRISHVLKRAYLILPILGVVLMLLEGYSPMLTGVTGIGLCWLVSLPDPERRMGPRKICDAIYEGTKGIPLICVACAVAGIVLGSVSLTGIGGKLVGFVIDLAGNTPFLALILIMFVSLVLGMGLPTTGAYILASALGAPVLIKLGFLPIAAHMFVFYYAIISNVTPPVALAAYAASSLSHSPPNQTGFEAMKLASIGFLVPFAFCYDPGILMQGGLVLNLIAILSGVCACLAFSAFWVGYAYAPLKVWERIILALAGIIVFMPQFYLVILGFVLIAFIWGFSYSRHCHAKSKPSELI